MNASNGGRLLLPQVAPGVVIGVHRPHLEQTARRAIPLHHQFSGLDDPKAQQRRRSPQINHVDRTVQPIFQSSANRQDPIKALQVIHVFDEKHCHIDITQAVRRRAREGTKQVGSNDRIICCQGVLYSCNG